MGIGVTTAEVAPPRHRLLLPAVAPGAVYLGVRLVGVAVLAVMAGGSRLVETLRAWDGSWLLAIARYGYAGVPDDMLDAYGTPHLLHRVRGSSPATPRSSPRPAR